MIRRLFQSDSGQAIAEAAVLIPVFVFVAFALIDIQWMTRTAAAIEYVVNEAARCEAIQSQACTAPQSTQGYAAQLAANMRLNANLQIATPPCSEGACNVSITYQYAELGAWFPKITINRTGTASIPPPTETGQ